MDSRYSGMPMFDASTVTGISKFEFLGFDQYGEAITDYKTPHVDSPEWFQKNKSREDQHRDLPANGFKLNVAVRYDTLFAGKFPRSTVAKYISINVSLLTLLELGDLGGFFFGRNEV